MSEPSSDSGMMVQIQIQLGTLQGTVNTLLAALSHRVTETEESARQLRKDLTSVKDNGIDSVNSLRTLVTQNTSAINGIISDVSEVKEKQNSSVQRAVLVISPTVGVIGLLWGIFGGKA